MFDRDDNSDVRCLREVSRTCSIGRSPPHTHTHECRRHILFLSQKKKIKQNVQIFLQTIVPFIVIIFVRIYLFNYFLVCFLCV